MQLNQCHCGRHAHAGGGCDRSRHVVRVAPLRVSPGLEIGWRQSCSFTKWTLRSPGASASGCGPATSSRPRGCRRSRSSRRTRMVSSTPMTPIHPGPTGHLELSGAAAGQLRVVVMYGCVGVGGSVSVGTCGFGNTLPLNGVVWSAMTRHC